MLVSCSTLQQFPQGCEGALCLAQSLLPVPPVCLSQHRKQLLGFVSLELKPCFSCCAALSVDSHQGLVLSIRLTLELCRARSLHIPQRCWVRCEVPEVWNCVIVSHRTKTQHPEPPSFCVHVTSNQESDLERVSSVFSLFSEHPVPTVSSLHSPEEGIVSRAIVLMKAFW